MKALKFAMVAAILSIAVISYAGIKPKIKANKIVRISLVKALQDPGLKAVMYDQCCLKYLKYEKRGLYSAHVVKGKTHYSIYGKKVDWIKFFRSQPRGGGGNLIGLQKTHW